MIGDKGVNLSGGQRARVNLARALYYDPDIYLLDDPLSAVDATVAKYLFDNCINGYLKSKIRILVTHQLHQLKNTDKILSLNDGKVKNIGKFELIRNSSLNKDALTKASEESRIKGEVERLSDIEDQLEDELTSSSLELIKKDEGTGDKEHIERATVGKIKWHLFGRFLRTSIPLIGPIVPFFLMLLFMLVQGFLMGADYWSSYWASIEDIDLRRKETRKSLYESCSVYSEFSPICSNLTSTDATITLFHDRMNFFTIYSTIITVAFVVLILRSAIYYLFFLNTTKLLHKTMLNSMLFAKTRFFDINPTGRIMNRFSKDMSNIDDTLPHNLFNFLQVFNSFSMLLL